MISKFKSSFFFYLFNCVHINYLAHMMNYMEMILEKKY